MKQEDMRETVARHQRAARFGQRFRRAADALATLPIPVKRTPVE